MQSSRSVPIANARCVMSEWSNQGMLQLPETIDRGLNTTCSWHCHGLCCWFSSAACVRSGFSIIARVSSPGMQVGRFSRPPSGVGVIAMPDDGLDTTRHVEVPPGAGLLWLLVPSVAVGEFIDRCCLANGVLVMCCVISATRELFSKDVGVEFGPWIVEATELPPREESLSPAGTETRFVAGGSWEFPEDHHLCWFWWWARLRTVCTTWVVSWWGHLEGIVQYRCSTYRM